jgi:hypothetical protein
MRTNTSSLLVLSSIDKYDLTKNFSDRGLRVYLTKYGVLDV